MTQTVSYAKRKDYKFLMYHSHIAFWWRKGNVIYFLTWGNASDLDVLAAWIAVRPEVPRLESVVAEPFPRR